MKVKLRLDSLELRDVPSVTEGLIEPPIPPEGIQVGEPSSRSWVDDFASRLEEIRGVLNQAILVADPQFGYQVALLGASATPETPAPGRSSADLQILLAPTEPDSARPLILIDAQASGLDIPGAVENYGVWDRVGRGLTGAIAGAGTGVVVGALSGPGAPVSSTTLAVVGGAGGFIYGCFIADDNAEAALGGVGSGLVAGPVVLIARPAFLAVGGLFTAGGGASTSQAGRLLAEAARFDEMANNLGLNSVWGRAAFRHAAELRNQAYSLGYRPPVD